MSPSAPASPIPPSDPAARPRPLTERLGLLLILLLLPVGAVMLPTLAVTHFFGRRPGPKQTATPASAPETSSLRLELDRKASLLLPTPAPLMAAPIRVSVHDPSHVGPRVEKIAAEAKTFGGAAVEGEAAAGERHLFIDLPAGTAEAFRIAVLENRAAEIPPPPAPTTVAGAARDQLEVFVRPLANDE